MVVLLVLWCLQLKKKSHVPEPRGRAIIFQRGQMQCDESVSSIYLSTTRPTPTILAKIRARACFTGKDDPSSKE
jgi:hypothetical protein